MRSHVWRDLICITLVGFVLRLLFIDQPGHVADLQTFGQWALNAADNPWDRGYEATNANYPPAALIVFELIGRTYRALGLNDPVALRIALKLPSAVFDLIGGGVLFGIAARFVPPRRALLATALFDLNPAIIYDSSLWGQNDSITLALTLGAVWCLLARRHAAAWIVLALAILNKPPVIVLGPLFALAAWIDPGPAGRRRALAQTALGIAGAVLCGYLLALPFYTDRSLGGVYARMIAWYRIGSSLYPYTSANGFNLWALAGDFFASDNQTALGVPLKYWADAAYIAIAAFVYRSYAVRPNARTLLEACFLLLLGFFLVLTEMHERYLLYALAFAPALAVLDRRYLWATIVITLTEWLNLEYSLTYMWLNSDKPPGIDPAEFAPVLVHLCVLGNIAAFVLGTQALLGTRAPTRVDREAA